MKLWQLLPSWKKKTFRELLVLPSLKFNQQELFKHKAELGISVHDDLQNLGIGTALLNHMIAISKMKELKKVWLIVNTKNDRAIYLYKKTGFEIEGTLRKETHLNGTYRDEYRMALFL